MTTWRPAFKASLKRALGLSRVADLPSSVVLWRGPSRLNGEPVMVVASRFRDPSKNEKTGDMVQIAIMSATKNPREAWSSEGWRAVCPEACEHTPARRGTCYVNKAKLRDAWERAVKLPVSKGIPWTGAIVRFGMDGDPSAVPLHVWKGIAGQAKGWTGYTASWRDLDPKTWGRYFMASCSSPADMLRAKSKGWRVFASSVSTDMDAEYQAAGAHLCLSERASVSCADCRGCAGTSKPRDYYIPIHGLAGARVREEVTA